LPPVTKNVDFTFSSASWLRSFPERCNFPNHWLVCLFLPFGKLRRTRNSRDDSIDRRFGEFLTKKLRYRIFRRIFIWNIFLRWCSLEYHMRLYSEGMTWVKKMAMGVVHKRRHTTLKNFWPFSPIFTFWSKKAYTLSSKSN